MKADRKPAGSEEFRTPATDRLASKVARQEPGRDEQQGDQGEQEPEAETGRPGRVLCQRTAQQQSPGETESLAGAVMDAARFDCPSALKSTIAAVEAPAVRPTPTPVMARPANSHSTSARRRTETRR